MDNLTRPCASPGMAKDGFRPYLASFIVVAVSAAVLLWLGRSIACECGTIRIWHGVTGPEASKHLFDIYSFHHVIHGFIFYAIAHFAMPKYMPGWGLFAATLVECIWEISENTDHIIGRFQNLVVAETYTGDTVVNSLADFGAMWIGFFIALRLPVWAAVGLALMFEIGSYALIRDSLFVTVFNLLRPAA